MREVTGTSVRVIWTAFGITNGITNSMKTAISVDDELMEQTDAAARDLGLSRSGLIAEALRGYLRQRAQARTTERLNQAYAGRPSENEMRLVRRLKTKVPVADKW
jgi:predicted transcriptional regulator